MCSNSTEAGSGAAPCFLLLVRDTLTLAAGRRDEKSFNELFLK